MINLYQLFHRASLCVAILVLSVAVNGQNKKVNVDWNKAVRISNTLATLQVVYNPMLKRGSAMHDGTFQSLKELKASTVRYVPWFPYPQAAVVELKEPTQTETFWNFTYADPVMEDLMQAQQGRSTVINFSTIPVWMFKTEKPVVVDADPDAVNWVYNQGRELRDPSGKEVAVYLARILSWYTRGGFTDELGKFHRSNHYYNIPYWEVLNEPDLEHKLSPQVYTKIYDETVAEMRKVQPNIKFVGISVALEHDPQWFEYFLNPQNHKPGTPLDAISYHFYGRPSVNNLDISYYQYSFFDQAEGFLDRVRYIENIRKRLSPNTVTHINEIGNILLDHDYKGVIPAGYWNLAGAMYAYLYVELSKIGIDVAGESQLVGYPTQFPDVSMMSWKTSKPNARYWVLKLLMENFAPGDKLLATTLSSQDVAAQAFGTSKGKKLLLINKHDKEQQVDLPADAIGATVSYVDISTGENKPGTYQQTDKTITLRPFAVAVVSFK